MTEPKDAKAEALSRDLLQGLDKLFGGPHLGFRAAHAKGMLFTGEFAASPEAASLTRAPHMGAHPTPVTVRLSDSAGIPNVPDNDPGGASPRGFAVRFHLGEHVHTDIVAHSNDGFPARTAEEFLEFLHAAGSTDPAGPHPNPIEIFLGSHPKALAFVQAPKPIPTSFAKESFFAVSAFKFTDADANVRFGRYQIHPELQNEYLDQPAAAAKSANFLFDEIVARIGKGPVKFHLVAQLAEEGDVTDDATIRWPDDRRKLELGVITLDTKVAEDDAEKHRMIFDPRPGVDGIDPSNDPLFEPRADVYLLSGRRRRATSHP